MKMLRFSLGGTKTTKTGNESIRGTTHAGKQMEMLKGGTGWILEMPERGRPKGRFIDVEEEDGVGVSKDEDLP